MITRKAYAKVNITLDVLGKREDGYHIVKMLMHSVNLYDVLTFEKIDTGIEFSMTEDNPVVPADKTNLVYRAAEAVIKEAGLSPDTVSPGVRITLEKNIPAAAGLAGGSTDAAATLKGGNELLGYGISEERLSEIGASLGADIPYCLMGGTALSEGIGEVLTPLPDFPEATFVLVKPECNVSTGAVYKAIDETDIMEEDRPDTDSIVKMLYYEQGESANLGTLRRIAPCMKNVLQLVTLPLHPEIGEIIECLENAGAVKAMMSGSGPTVFAIFDDEKLAEKALTEVKQLDTQNVWKQFLLTSDGKEM